MQNLLDADPIFLSGLKKIFFHLLQALDVEADVTSKSQEEAQLWFVWISVTVFFLDKLASLVGFCFVKAALDRVGRSTFEMMKAQAIYGDRSGHQIPHG